MIDLQTLVNLLYKFVPENMIHVMAASIVAETSLQVSEAVSYQPFRVIELTLVLAFALYLKAYVVD